MVTSKSTHSKRKNKLLLNIFFVIIGGIAIFLLLLSFFNLFFEKLNEDKTQFFIDNDTANTFKVVALAQDSDMGIIYATHNTTIKSGRSKKFYQDEFDHLRCVILEQQTEENPKPLFHLNINALNANQETNPNIKQLTYKISEIIKTFSDINNDDNDLCLFYMNNINEVPGKGQDAPASDEQWFKIKDYFIKNFFEKNLFR